MQIHTLIQQSPEWHAYRDQCDNASDAPAMMGESPYKKRSDLIRERATGAVSEIDASTQARFDDGRRFEELARPLAEEILGEDLYPVVGSLGRLSASFDGVTMAHDIAWEHKTLNADIRKAKTAADLGLHLRIQMEQQLAVSGATKCLFTATKWDQSGNLIEKRELWYEPDLELRARIIAGWEQFALDVAAYQHVEVLPAVTADAVLALPSLSIRVLGEMSLQSNLPEFGVRLKAFIADIVTEPKTDQDFANAENAIKILKAAEEALDQAEAAALAQTVSIDEMRKVKQMYFDLSRDTRLMMEKVVKIRKETIRIEILAKAKSEADSYIANLNSLIGKPYMPAIAHDFPGVMKSQKTVTSLQNKVDTELAQFKVRADAVFKTIMFNITTLRELAPEYPFLFADSAQIVLKATDDCTSLIKVRIAEHKEAEAKRLAAETARIAEQERIKAEAKVREAQDIEDALITSIEKESRRIEGDSVPYIEKAMRTFESGAKNWDCDTRPRVVSALESGRAYLQDRLNAAKERSENANKSQILQEQADSLEREKASRAAAQKAAEAAPAPVLAQAGAERLLNPSPVYPFPKAAASANIETLPSGQPHASRPTDAQIIDVIASHFNVTMTMARDWVRDMDLFNSRPPIVMTAVKSSQIAAIGHDPETDTLAIQFTGKDGPGSVYHYKNIDVEKFEALKNAESIGIHFGKYIKNAADRHPFLKVG